MTVIQKHIVDKQSAFEQSLADMLKKVADNRKTDDDESFETRLNAFARWCFSCGREIGTIEGYELGENHAPLGQKAHLN